MNTFPSWLVPFLLIVILVLAGWGNAIFFVLMLIGLGVIVVVSALVWTLIDSKATNCQGQVAADPLNKAARDATSQCGGLELNQNTGTGQTPLEIPEIYVRGGTLFQMVEDPTHARITMLVDLPIVERTALLEPRILVFDGVHGHTINEGLMNGHPTLLDFKVVGTEGQRTRVRIETTVGYREILCRSVRVLEHNPVAKPLNEAVG